MKLNDQIDTQDQGKEIEMTITAVGTQVLENANAPTSTKPTVAVTGAIVTVTNNQTVASGATVAGVSYGVREENESSVTWTNDGTNGTHAFSNLETGNYYISTKTTDSEGYETISAEEGPIEIIYTSPKVSVYNSQTEQYEEVKLTAENATQYYGRAVNYDNSGITWRIFYVDFANKYGDGEGTIYLKADYSASRSTNLNSYASYNSSKTKVRQMNPAWADGATSATVATKRGNNEANWNINEKAAAWLCDPTVNTWSQYNVTGKSKYVIGAPSAEMWIDSYQKVNSNIKYQYSYSSYPGYKYSGNGGSSYRYSTSNNSLALDAMYTNTTANGYWWLASPSSTSANYVCYVDCSIRTLSRGYSSDSYGVCPLVCLESGVTLQIQ